MGFYLPCSSTSFVFRTFRKQTCHILTVTRRGADLFNSMGWGFQRRAEPWSVYERDCVSVPVAAGTGTDDQKASSSVFLFLWSMFKDRAFSIFFLVCFFNYFFRFCFCLLVCLFNLVLIVPFWTKKHWQNKMSWLAKYIKRKNLDKEARNKDGKAKLAGI